MKKLTKIFITAGIALLTGLLAVFFSNMGVISHASARAVVEEQSFLKTTVADSSSRYTLVFNDTGNQSRGRFISRLLLEILPEVDQPSDLVFTIRMAGEQPGYEYDRSSDLSTAVITDLNPIYVKTEVLKLNMDNVLTITVEGNSGTRFTLGNVTVDNSFVWNRRIFFFGLMAGLVICLAVVPSVMSIFRLIRSGQKEDCFRTGKSVTAAFLVISLSLGTALCLSIPVNKAGYDEETHLQAVLQMAGFPSGELHLSGGIVHQVTVTEFNNPDAQPKGETEAAEFAENLDLDANYKTGDQALSFHVMANRIPAYFTMAVVMKVCKGLSLPWSAIVILTRLANLFTYIALLYLALRVLPRGHMLMALIGLLPLNLFLASTVSYDAFITGCLCVGMAYLIKIVEDTRAGAGLSMKDTLLMLLFMLLACLVKAVYAPLILSAFIVPAAAFKDKQHRAFFFAAVVFAFLLTVLLFIVPTLVAPSASGDTRGGETVSEVSQIGFILSDPFGYVRLLLSEMAARLRQYLLGPDCTTFMGHFITPYSEFQGYWIPYALMLMIPAPFGIARFVCEKKAGTPHFLGVRERLWLLFMCFGAAALAWTAMYVAFTPAGLKMILGVQGRYFVPLLFPVWFSLFADGPAEVTGERVFIARTEQICYYIMIITLSVLTAMSVLTCVVIPYCA